ncbi:hypothetical protein BDV96DRAFT_130710 [Lophiotrema nucula]|uniref:HAUS augmin-like complex subunit 1 n=1 Tax=Lophiotrema nucula TaxID=690887 RepID=A0A6A5ZUF0_9PLEO|nr:hypothetical protein BDV96DRAFT_130710 [Lophiotrema nucula]
MDSLTPSDLFSPSKARQQRAQAQDWAQIDGWLSYKYAGRTIPSFERNEEALEVLRELSMANERADEERMVREKLEREALKELDEQTPTNEGDKRILDSITTNLTSEGNEAISALASTAVTLNTPSPNAETIAHTLIRHTSTAQTLTNQLAYIETLQRYLEKQHSLLRTQLTELTINPAFSTPSTLQRQTTEQVRQTKHLRTKVREHEDKLSALQIAQSRNNKGADVGSAEAIGEMLEQQKALDELKGGVEELEREVEEFAGLPADREAARKEVGKLEVELDGLRRRRDALFEGMFTR